MTLPRLFQPLRSALAPPFTSTANYSETTSAPGTETQQTGGNSDKATRRHQRARRSKEPKKVGDHAEKIVRAHEEKRLREAGRIDLADKVDWPAARAEFPGWDISSFETDGTPRRIEVKGSTGKIDVLEVTANEWTAARHHREEYYLYLVHDTFKRTVKLETIRDPAGLVEKGFIACRPSVYSVKLAAARDYPEK